MILVTTDRIERHSTNRIASNLIELRRISLNRNACMESWVTWSPNIGLLRFQFWTQPLLVRRTYTHAFDD